MPGQAVQVFRAADLYVSSGVNLGDDLAGPDAVCPGDGYELEDDAQAHRLAIRSGGTEAGQAVSEGSEIGAPGEPIEFLASYTLLATDGERVEVLILSVGTEAHGGAIFALPMSPMARRFEYTLIGVNPAPAGANLADLVCVSFARGTEITLATGEQRRIEALESGARVLTRDHGPQEVRWIGHATLRAVGAFAPVVISAGALGNTGDLIVSQHHRMFIYEPGRKAGLPTSEVLIQAKHLVDGSWIFLREGGYLDYFCLIFDRHEIIYAEGIPAESLMVTETTIARLPEAMADEVRRRFPGLRHLQHYGTEAGRDAALVLGKDTKVGRLKKPLPKGDAGN
jgi:hypothetical protein